MKRSKVLSDWEQIKLNTPFSFENRSGTKITAQIMSNYPVEVWADSVASGKVLVAVGTGHQDIAMSARGVVAVVVVPQDEKCKKTVCFLHTGENSQLRILPEDRERYFDPDVDMSPATNDFERMLKQQSANAEKREKILQAEIARIKERLDQSEN